MLSLKLSATSPLTASITATPDLCSSGYFKILHLQMCLRIPRPPPAERLPTSTWERPPTSACGASPDLRLRSVPRPPPAEHTLTSAWERLLRGLGAEHGLLVLGRRDIIKVRPG
ncbi:hypothetical protein NHX12_011604 [Muraenolepis orangiensis]|uniref:Uncharacterized protein n=1 Tax=Muraenolepis orangiensis TaxID=630683 RepID=A0A9Q0I7C5_9TELE|nr:hypothetical protein NHX12_011604 [Muraenolepis orangiensis]